MIFEDLNCAQNHLSNHIFFAFFGFKLKKLWLFKIFDQFLWLITRFIIKILISYSRELESESALMLPRKPNGPRTSKRAWPKGAVQAQPWPARTQTHASLASAQATTSSDSCAPRPARSGTGPGREQSPGAPRPVPRGCSSPDDQQKKKLSNFFYIYLLIMCNM